MKALLVILTVVMLGTVAWLLAYEKPPDAPQTCVGQEGTCCMSRGKSPDMDMTCKAGCDKPGTVVAMCQGCGGPKGDGCTCPGKSADMDMTCKTGCGKGGTVDATCQACDGPKDAGCTCPGKPADPDKYLKTN